MLINIIHKINARFKFNNLSCRGFFIWHLVFICFGEKILSAMYADQGPPHLSLVVCYIVHLLIPLLCKIWFYKDCNRNCKNSVLDVIRTLGTSNQAIYYNLQNICFSSLIDLDTLIIMSPKLDAPYLWIRPLDLVPLNLAYGLLLRSSWTVYTIWSLWCIYQLLQKHSIATITQLRNLELLIVNLLYCICYTIIIDWHMIFGLEQESGSLIAPMALAHPLHPIDNRSRNRRLNLWVRWCVSSWWPLFPSRSSVLKYVCIFYMSSVLGRIYTYSRSVIQYWWSCTPSHFIELYFWGVRTSWVECHFCFLWFTNCVLLSDDNSLIPGCLWILVFVLNSTLILGIWCYTIPHPPGCFCPWTFFQNIGCHRTPLCHI